MMTLRTRHLAALIVLAVACLSSEQTAKAQTLAPAACQQFFSASGIPLAGGFLYSYTAGTSTPTPTYADSAASIPNSNPIILNAGGYPVSATGGCGIWLSTSVSYKFVVQNSTHTAQWTVDNISPLNVTALLSMVNTWTAAQTFSAAANLNGGGAMAGTFTGTPTFSGNVTFSGAPTFSGNPTFSGSPSFTTGVVEIGPSIIYADQLTPSSGLCSVTGTDASAKIQCAINLLPAAGGVVNAINLQDGSGTGSTTIDPGTAKAVTLYLGPYTYQIKQIVLRSNFHIIGTGMGSQGSIPPTILQQCSTCGATNTIVLSGALTGTQHVLLDGFRVYAVSGATSIGVNLAGAAGGGLWYSTMRNLCIGDCGPSLFGFAGGTFILDGTASGALNQFDDFYNIQAFRGSSSGYSLGLLGSNGQLTFNQCQFDGPTRNDGSTDVQIAASTGNTGPYSITFNGSTVQHATLGVNIAGAQSITFINTHFETIGEAIQINTGVGTTSSASIAFINSTCQNFCANNSSAGWWAKNLSPASGTQAVFIGNQIQPTADAFYVGFSNFQAFTSVGDEESTTSTITPLANIGNNTPILTSLTTTSGTSDNVTVTGMTSTGHCSLTSTNASAATNIATTYVSAKTTNQITVTHTGTASMTYDILCTPN